MKIEILNIPEEGRRYEGTEPADILELEPGDQIRSASEPVHYELFVELISKDLIVRGTVSAAVGLACSRCAEISSTFVNDSAFLRAYEIEPDQEEVDINPDLRDAILLYSPTFPLCRENCAGLCPLCGVNRNRDQCSCRGDETDLRWNSLDTLRFDKE